MRQVLSLDNGRWMATSCPVEGLHCDGDFLRFLDVDGNGRILSDEVRAAVAWLLDRLRPSDTWTRRQSSLPLDLIRTDTPAGVGLRETAERVLDNLGVSNATQISLDHVRDRQRILQQADYNGDGVIPGEVVRDPAAAAFVRHVVAALGGVKDASGALGVDEPLLTRFREEATAYLDWRSQSSPAQGESTSETMPFGAATPALFDTVTSVQPKVEEFYAQCALVRTVPSAKAHMDIGEEELAALDYRDPAAVRERLRAAPLAPPNAEAILPLTDGVNEHYRSAMGALYEQVVPAVLGESRLALGESEWRQILQRFAAHSAWTAARPPTAVGRLGVDTLREYLTGPCEATVRALIAEDRAAAAELARLGDLHRLLLYHQWLFEFVNNFVSFPRLFSLERRALFEMGTLILGGQAFALCVKVRDRATHAEQAKNSGMYLLYLRVSGPAPQDNYEIAVPVTRGDPQRLYVGRRGIFLGVSGKELDAQVVQVVENPVGVSYAVKGPLRRLQAMVAGRAEQLTGVAQKEAETSVAKVATDVEASVQEGIRRAQQAAPPSAPVSPADAPTAAAPVRSSVSARDLLVGGGVALAGVGTALKFLTDVAAQLMDVATLLRLFGVLGAFVGLITVTTVINVWWRLRRRDVGVLLQASGWAINGRMRLTGPMARLFTRPARIPPNATLERWDVVRQIEKIARSTRWTRPAGPPRDE
jgi:hypothetical protein